MNEEELLQQQQQQQFERQRAEAYVQRIAIAEKFNQDMQKASEYRSFKTALDKMPKPIGEKQIAEATQRLLKYKSGKSELDRRIIENEEYFKLRHLKNSTIKPTGWLFNVIMSKHADMMDGYPEPNILPKEENDRADADMLKSIVPVVYEGNGFRRTYNECSWYKLIKGTAVYGIFWDGSKLNGKGDISVEKVDILNLFWEPGISDIRESREVFVAKLVDAERVEQMFPETKGRIGKTDTIGTKQYLYDDHVDTTGKVRVIDWYYKKQIGNKTVLHYCKYVDNIVLYATENDMEMPTMPVIDPVTAQPVTDGAGNVAQVPTDKSRAEKGWYDHGLYPFVFDPLFRIEGTPTGYSYIDICKSTQDDIDSLNHSIIKNAMLTSRPRYFVRNDGSVNEDEFADFSKDIIHCEGASVGDDSLRLVSVPQLNGNAIGVLQNKVEELKEISGNRDVNNGSTGSSVTAASAIAALQESAGKTSRDSLGNTYEAYKGITYQVIELIRRFYTSDRTFRITGKDGQYQFVHYSNAGIKPQPQGSIGDVELGSRIPQFDIEVNARKATAYNKMSQNELALQFYNSGIFAPNNADQALAVLDMMDFAHKDEVIQKVQMNMNLQQMVERLLQISMALASKYEPDTAAMLGRRFGLGAPAAPSEEGAPERNAPQSDSTGMSSGETRVAKARERTQNSTRIN